MAMTAEQIRTRGLAVLRKELGAAGLIRFLQQVGAGSGDYTKQRSHTNADLTMATIRHATQKRKQKA